MTPNKVIEYVDRVRPNAYTDEDKYAWLNTLEGTIALEVMGEDAAGEVGPGTADTELLVSAPYDDVYTLYVMAMIDFHNREYDNYNNMALMFQQKLEQYKAWYIQNNMPKSARNFRNVMG